MAQNLLRQDEAGTQGDLEMAPSLVQDFAQLTSFEVSARVLSAAGELSKLKSNLAHLHELVGKHHMVMEELSSVLSRKR